MPSPKTKGNIDYSDSDSIIEEVYDILKDDVDINSIITNYHDPDKTENDNIKRIEELIDVYIKSNTDLQTRIANVYKKRNIIIPLIITTEKNEIIDAKKILIKEEITKLKNI